MESNAECLLGLVEKMFRISMVYGKVVNGDTGLTPKIVCLFGLFLHLLQMSWSFVQTDFWAHLAKIGKKK